VRTTTKKEKNDDSEGEGMEDSKQKSKAEKKKKKRKKTTHHDEGTAALKPNASEETKVVDGDGDSSEDEQDLMAAAAAWAAQDGDEADDTPPQKASRRMKQRSAGQLHETPASSAPPNQVYSLHVTQLSYDATDFDVRHHFVSAGCAVTGVRLVYDRALNTKTFRGVAFVDVADKESYETALKKLHSSKMLQRKINVRAVKTKQELAAIVKQTAEQVASQIQEEKAKKKEREKKNDEKGSISKKEKQKGDKDKEKGDKSSKRKRVGKDGDDDTAVGKMRKHGDVNRPPKQNSSDQKVNSRKPSPAGTSSDAKKPQNKFSQVASEPRKAEGTSSPANSKKALPPQVKPSPTATSLKEQNSSEMKDSQKKLTKQQRNRRAAILRSKMGKQ
jgi:RNA recognition motif-containing protein